MILTDFCTYGTASSSKASLIRLIGHVTPFYDLLGYLSLWKSRIPNTNWVYWTVWSLYL